MRNPEEHAMPSARDANAAGSCPLARRQFLRGAGAVGAGVLFLPTLPALSRKAVAAPGAPARRLLIFNLTGGVRSSAAFFAAPDGDVAHNPWGVIPGTGTTFALGRALDDNLPAGSRLYQPARDAALPPEAYQLGPLWGNAAVPRLRDMAKTFAVLGTWHRERGDHIRARIEEVTGSPSGAEAGLLSRIHRALASTSGASAEIPPFHLQPTATFGLAPADFASFAPVGMAGPQSLPGASQMDPAIRKAVGHGYGDDDLHARLDQGRIQRRAGFARNLAEVFAVHRRASRRIGARLAEPWLNVTAPDPYGGAVSKAPYGQVLLPSGQMAALTSEMLYELVVRTLGPDPADPARRRPLPNPTTHPFHDAAVNTALAIRLLQLGSPAVVVEIGSFDLHSGEADQAPVLYRMLGRLWATVGWLLSRMPEPDGSGVSMFDRTLAVTMSDFGRDRGSASTGFNAGEGSDHGTDASCFYLAHAMMGAGVVGGKTVGGVSPTSFDASRESGRVSPRQLLATLIWSLGLDHRSPVWGFEDVQTPEPLAELWKP